MEVSLLVLENIIRKINEHICDWSRLNSWNCFVWLHRFKLNDTDAVVCSVIHKSKLQIFMCYEELQLLFLVGLSDELILFIELEWILISKSIL